MKPLSTPSLHFIVRWRQHGKQHQQTFRTREDAEHYADSLDDNQGKHVLYADLVIHRAYFSDEMNKDSRMHKRNGAFARQYLVRWKVKRKDASKRKGCALWRSSQKSFETYQEALNYYMYLSEAHRRNDDFNLYPNFYCRIT
jgi:hypothetical protein